MRTENDEFEKYLLPTMKNLRKVSYFFRNNYINRFLMWSLAVNNLQPAAPCLMIRLQRS